MCIRDSCAPVSPYGLHKYLCEQMVLAEARMTGLDVSIVRFFSIYGPGLRKQILWDIMSRVYKDPDQELELWGDGTETRDFLYVDDAAHLVAKIAETRSDSNPRIFNGGSGTSVSVAKFAKVLIEVAGFETKLVFNGRTRSGDPKHLTGNVRKAANSLGFLPKTLLDNGLSEYVQWFNSIIKQKGEIE